MVNNRVFRFALLASGALLVAACATQPATTSLDEKYFQREADNYLKFQHEGRTVYCVTKDSNDTLIPYTGNVRCVTEARLRQVVENARLARNTVAYTKW
jgi:hypothetical protein